MSSRDTGIRSPLELSQLALSVAMTVGVLTLARPCDIQADASPMACHWAGRVVVGIGITLVIVGVLRLAMPVAVRLGISLATVPLALLAAAVPGVLVDLCLLGSMRCNAIMRPTVIIAAAAVGALGAIDALSLWRQVRRGA